jgi:NDP-sugar pyrophosphorylase family protein
MITAHFDDSLWIDVGTVDRLKRARRVLKDEN